MLFKRESADNIIDDYFKANRIETLEDVRKAFKDLLRLFGVRYRELAYDKKHPYLGGGFLAYRAEKNGKVVYAVVVEGKRKVPLSFPDKFFIPIIICDRPDNKFASVCFYLKELFETIALMLGVRWIGGV